MFSCYDHTASEQAAWSKAHILWNVNLKSSVYENMLKWLRLGYTKGNHRKQSNQPYPPEAHQLIEETMSKQKIRLIKVKTKVGAMGTNQRGHWIRLFRAGWFSNLWSGQKEQLVHVKDRNTRKYSGTDQSWRLFFFFFWPCSWHVKVSRPGIKPLPVQWPRLLQWQCQILNLLSH